MGTEIPSSPPPHPYQTCMKNKERQKVVHDGLAESQSGLSPKSFPHVGKLFCFPRSLEEKKKHRRMGKRKTSMHGYPDPYHFWYSVNSDTRSCTNTRGKMFAIPSDRVVARQDNAMWRHSAPVSTGDQVCAWGICGNHEVPFGGNVPRAVWRRSIPEIVESACGRTS